MAFARYTCITVPCIKRHPERCGCATTYSSPGNQRTPSAASFKATKYVAFPIEAGAKAHAIRGRPALACSSLNRMKRWRDYRKAQTKCLLVMIIDGSLSVHVNKARPAPTPKTVGRTPESASQANTRARTHKMPHRKNKDAGYAPAHAPAITLRNSSASSRLNR